MLSLASRECVYQQVTYPSPSLPPPPHTHTNTHKHTTCTKAYRVSQRTMTLSSLHTCFLVHIACSQYLKIVCTITLPQGEVRTDVFKNTPNKAVTQRICRCLILYHLVSPDKLNTIYLRAWRKVERQAYTTICSDQIVDKRPHALSDYLPPNQTRKVGLRPMKAKHCITQTNMFVFDRDGNPPSRARCINSSTSRARG